MRVKQLLAVSLSVALALPPSGHAQSASAPPLESAAGGARSISTVPSGIAAGVLGRSEERPVWKGVIVRCMT
ncbi:hypothetical protein, partial [Burkholderia sp. Ac-20392]|uniref:hypothetical protein n=1 Tax=Burkholderia sp. Ac-20392 TaxID=2703905 RepID=UPI001981A613